MSILAVAGLSGPVEKKENESRMVGSAWKAL